MAESMYDQARAKMREAREKATQGIPIPEDLRLTREETNAVISHHAPDQAAPVQLCQRHRREYLLPHDCPLCAEETQRKFHAAEVRRRDEMRRYLISDMGEEWLTEEKPPSLFDRLRESWRNAGWFAALVIIGVPLLILGLMIWWSDVQLDKILHP